MNIGYTIRRGVIYVNIWRRCVRVNTPAISSPAATPSIAAAASSRGPDRDGDVAETGCATVDSIPADTPADSASGTPSAGVNARRSGGGAPGTALPGAG